MRKVLLTILLMLTAVMLTACVVETPEEVSELKEQIASLNTQISEKQATISDLEAQLDANSKRISALEQGVDELEELLQREPPKRFEETRSLMATYVKVVIYADEGIAEEAINAAFARMEEIDRIATTWDSEGEAFKLNQTGYSDTPSDELLELINLSLYYSELTDGSFDITVQPLLDLWEYNPDADKQFWELDESTQQAEINKALKLVGPDQIIIGDNTIHFKEEGTEITLGAIAKGYAVDEALEALKDMGIRYALVDAGGDIGTLGSKPEGELWQVALVNPDDTSQSLATFGITDKAIATSGNYERYFDLKKEVHHIINPETGYSATGSISVTIIAQSCIQADALATAVFVMGAEDGMELVESLDDVECLIVDADRIIHRSSGLSEYRKQS